MSAAAANALEETIGAQPELLERTLELDLTPALSRLAGARRVLLVGTGTSQHAAELGALMLADAGCVVAWFSSATFASVGPPLARDDAVIVISHTTESAFARAARARARSARALVAITGPGRDWEEAIETPVRERSETYTASYTTALLVLARLARGLGASGIDDDTLRSVPDMARDAIALAERDQLLLPERALVIAGSGPAAITAREGALKLREAARVLSEGYEAEYLLHGGAVPLDARDALMLLAPEGDPNGLVAELGRVAAAAGLAVTVLTGPGDAPPVLAQIPLTIRLQLLAARAARQRGHDPDTVIVDPWTDEVLWSLGAPG